MNDELCRISLNFLCLEERKVGQRKTTFRTRNQSGRNEERDHSFLPTSIEGRRLHDACGLIDPFSQSFSVPLSLLSYHYWNDPPLQSDGPPTCQLFISYDGVFASFFLIFYEEAEVRGRREEPASERTGHPSNQQTNQPTNQPVKQPSDQRRSATEKRSVIRRKKSPK